AFYAAQWIAVIGFLPTIYTLAGITGTVAGVLTAVVAGSNAVGCFMAGRFLHRGVASRTLMITGYVTMAVVTFIAFGLPVPVWAQFVLILAFSVVGGLTPPTLFGLVMKLARSAETTTTSIG